MIIRNSDHYPVEQSVYVPSTTSANKRVSPSAYKRRIRVVQSFLSKKFGGYTSVNAIGGYVSDSKGLIREPVVKVTSYAAKGSYRKNKKDVIGQVRRWGSSWGQESMGYEHEGDLYYIKSQKQKVARKRRINRSPLSIAGWLTKKSGRGFWR